MTEAQAPNAAPAQKAKPPAPEDKPFIEFINQDYLPALQQALGKIGLGDVAVEFAQKPLPISGADGKTYWQVQGRWPDGSKTFNLYFFEGSIKGAKGFSYSVDNIPPSTLESFMIDEKKVTLDLMVLYTLQRLNGQKWLGGN